MRADRRLLMRALLCSVAVLLLSAGTTVAAILLQVADVTKVIRESQPPIPGVRSALDDVDPGKPQTLLLIGSDHRYESDLAGAVRADVVPGAKTQANADTMILVRLDPAQPATTVLSIPRDLQVEIPGYGMGKVNSSYALGGAVLTAKTLRRLLGIPIHHVFVTTFTAFERGVDAIGCVYADVDHRYYVPPEASYAEIDLHAGYQRLCGQDALSFVRFRHADTDIVRAARQQLFLRAALHQAKRSGLLVNAKRIVRILASYTQTDVRSSSTLLRLLKIGLLSSGRPVSQVSFPAVLADDPSDTFVYTQHARVREVVDGFLHPQGPERTIKAVKRVRRAAKPVQLAPAPARRDEVRRLRRRVGFPVYDFGRVIPGSSAPAEDALRAYSIRDDSGKRRRAYRITMHTGEAGEYYGLQGTTWMTPPMLSEATGTLRLHGVEAQVATSGRRITWIAWRQGRRLYWLSNTLSRSLSNREMVALARAATDR